MSLPVARSKQTTDCDPRDSSAVARKIWFPTTVGELWPRPGIGVFHAMFSVSLQWIGGFWPGAAMPSRVGPRHAGQSLLGSIAAASVVKQEKSRTPMARAQRLDGKEIMRASLATLAEAVQPPE